MSYNTKSSSTEEKRSRISAISACFTVSMPNSPSRSWSISMKSAGYPGCGQPPPRPRPSMSGWVPDVGAAEEAGGTDGVSGAGCAGAAGGASCLFRTEHGHLHALDVANHVVQRWMVGENKVLVTGKSKLVSNVRHDFGLLHCVNAQSHFKVLVEFNEVGRIPGVWSTTTATTAAVISASSTGAAADADGVAADCSGCWCRDWESRASTVGVAGVAGAGAGASLPAVMRLM